MNDYDRQMMKWVCAFNPYGELKSTDLPEQHWFDVVVDLYSKADKEPSVEELRPYYLNLIAKYFPDKIQFWNKGRVKMEAIFDHINIMYQTYVCMHVAIYIYIYLRISTNVDIDKNKKQ